jgi:hypothetical protein
VVDPPLERVGAARSTAHAAVVLLLVLVGGATAAVGPPLERVRAAGGVCQAALLDAFDRSGLDDRRRCGRRSFHRYSASQSMPTTWPCRSMRSANRRCWRWPPTMAGPSGPTTPMPPTTRTECATSCTSARVSTIGPILPSTVSTIQAGHHGGITAPGGARPDTLRRPRDGTVRLRVSAWLGVARTSSSDPWCVRLATCR